MGLSSAEQSALGDFKRTLAGLLGDRELGVTLFGSKARGDDCPDSDVDVLVLVSSNDWHVADRVYEVATRILIDTGVVVSPKVIPRSRFQTMICRQSPFALRVSREGLPV